MEVIDEEIKIDDMQEYDLDNLPALVSFPPLQRVICAAYNYHGYDAVAEMNITEPVLFFKTLTSICGPGDPIVIPLDYCGLVWPEVELAFVISSVCKNIHPMQADYYIIGYTVANDVTAENILKRDNHLLRAKGLDTFCPMLPWLRTDIDTKNLNMYTKVNGKIVQEGNTSNMLWNPQELLALLSKFITLLPGDVILTGTPPHSFYPLADGDEVEVGIDGFGSFTNPVKEVRS